jgi:hypothetical protein
MIYSVSITPNPASGRAHDSFAVISGTTQANSPKAAARNAMKAHFKGKRLPKGTLVTVLSRTAKRGKRMVKVLEAEADGQGRLFPTFTARPRRGAIGKGGVGKLR